jgi:hypothetical protein
MSKRTNTRNKKIAHTPTKFGRQNFDNPVDGVLSCGVQNTMAHTYERKWKPKVMTLDIAGVWKIKFAEVHTEHDQHIGSPKFVRGYASGKMMSCNRMIGEFNGKPQIVYTDYKPEVIKAIFSSAGHTWEPK